MKKVFIFIGIIVFVAAVAAFLFRDELEEWFLRPTESSIESGVSTIDDEQNVDVALSDLDTPWAIAFLPNGDYLVSERPGRLTRVGENGQTYEIAGVKETSEGGLLGVAVDPGYEQNNFIYLYLTTEVNDGLENRIDKFVLKDDELTKQATLIEGIPGASFHDGGRLAFGPDNKLYATTGDAGNPDSAQDTDSLAGKILRINADGSVPADNPFNNYVYSYGHRNPQGIAWDDEGRLWSTEHGPSGLESGQDEVNLIEKGGNYGWPVIRGQETAEGMISPVVESGTDETWAPASLAYANGSLFFGGLRGQTLYEAKINDNNRLDLVAHFREMYGRLREVSVQGDALYMTTSNRDGRGDPAESDDRIIKMPLAIFQGD